MIDPHRRRFLGLAAQTAGMATALAAFPPSIRRALAIPASRRTGTIADVRHIVILMQENRSFDHYFGTLRGVRGFGDRHPVPLASGKPVWHQFDGEREVTPFHFDIKTTSALRTPGTPHTFRDAQAAWQQGKLGAWPKFKTPIAMGHFRRDDIPFQFALAEAFTLCDAHHCSVATGTDPNRIVFMSGSNFNPELRARGIDCTDTDSEPVNLRCHVKGPIASSTSQYIYQGSAFTWPTIPEVLERAGISWRIYQDPNDNWSGLMHGGLAFESFRTSRPGDALYEKGMTPGWLDEFSSDVRKATLPSVSWILPSQIWSEHPSGSSALQGAEFTARILDTLTANPKVWAKTVLFITFDENDGLFDHAPPPAPPSYNADGTLAGKATLDLKGLYFSNPDRKYIHPDDRVSGTLRPWGLGPRVPLYVVSPWSRGGWVNSQVFDHTSVGQFLENRFGVTIPAISPWHRAVCGNLTSAFDFVAPNNAPFPELPSVRDSAATVASGSRLPNPTPPRTPQKLFQEPGLRRSRALPYQLHVHARTQPSVSQIELIFQNTGRAGAVFHVYDKLHLDRIPRRYMVEAGKSLTDEWALCADDGRYDLWVYGPNGFVREFKGKLSKMDRGASPEVEARYDSDGSSISLVVSNTGHRSCELIVCDSAYGIGAPWSSSIAPRGRSRRQWPLASTHGWYDLTVTGENFHRRFAGRVETGAHGYSDPAMGLDGNLAV